MLHCDKDKILTDQGDPVQLRGVCIGGWMNMESFINGFPGVEMTLRHTFARAMGEPRAQAFFDRWLDYFFTEADVAFISRLGANVVRLPVNYRHLESDARPFHYLDKGFERLERAVSWCEKYGLYAILDLHAAPGWQSPDWHCDNPAQRALFWEQSHFQERFVALWAEIARRFTGREAIAGYDLLNEPLTDEWSEPFYGSYQPDWETLNSLYRRTVETIRKVDGQHIIFLEGDGFASRFDGLAAPFDANLAVSSHNYNRAGWGPGDYPGVHREGYWDRAMVEKVFAEHQGTQYARRYQVPLWVGEFGSVFNGRPEEHPDRLRGFDDNIAVFDASGANWTAWTYKDIGVMGWMVVDSQSEYLQLTRPVQEAIKALHTDTWMYWMPTTAVDHLMSDAAGQILHQAGDLGVDQSHLQGQLARALLAGRTGALMQPVFARLFAEKSDAEIDRILQSFAIERCHPNPGVLEIVRRHLQPNPEPVEEAIAG